MNSKNLETQDTKAVEPSSPFVWNVIDVLQVIAAIIASALAGVTEPMVYALLGGSIVRKVWPLVEAARKSAAAARGGVIATMLALNGLTAVASLTACAGFERRGEVLQVVMEDDPAKPPPACQVRLELDGKQVGPTHYAERCKR